MDLFIMDIQKVTSKGMDVEVLVKMTDRDWGTWKYMYMHKSFTMTSFYSETAFQSLLNFNCIKNHRVHIGPCKPKSES